MLGRARQISAPFLRNGALCWALCAALVFALPQALHADGRAIIVLDASGSMWDDLNGRPKVEIAREALNAVLQVLPADVELGLLAYGHREKGNCDDIELIVPPATGRAAAISTAAEFLNFTGKTPLTAAVQQAAAALDYERRQATVILITDGVDNCSGDPCALAATLEDAGANFTTHVVGFGLKADEAATVACLASGTGGSYLQADDLETLTLALQDTVLVPDIGPTPALPAPEQTPDPIPAPPAPEPPPPVTEPAPEPLLAKVNFAPRVVLSAGGPPVDAPGQLRFSLQSSDAAGADPILVETADAAVPPGRYLMITTLGAVTVSAEVTVPPTGIFAPEVVLNAAHVTLRPSIGPNARLEGDTDITITAPSGFSASLTGAVETWLPAGDLTLTARLDAVSVTMPLKVVAGQALTQDIFISAAVVVPKVFYTAGQPVNAADLQIDIVSARPNVDGSRTLVSRRTAAAPVFHLGAGDYTAIATLGLASIEVPFSIALVQRTELPIILNAGVLAALAPGADMIRIGPPPDIAGNAPPSASFQADTVLETLTAGTYQVQARFGDATAVADITITPGARTEVTLTPP